MAENDDSGAVLRAVSRQIRLWREAAGLKQPELGDAIGYSAETVSAVERGKRLPSPEFLVTRTRRSERRRGSVRKSRTDPLLVR